MLSHNAPTPLYVQLLENIRNAITSGEWKPDTQIPSERELCNKYNVSRITVRQALAEAENTGLLYKIQGKGTFVKPPKIRQGLTKITSFGKTLHTSGLNAATTILDSSIVPVNLQLSSIFKTGMDAEVLNLKLLGLANSEPVVYYSSYFPLDIGQIMLEAARQHEKSGTPFSTYDLYTEADIAADTVDQTFEAVNCSSEIAKHMKIKPGTALLVVTSIVHTKDSRPVEFKTAMYRADKYKFHLTRSM